MNSRARKKEKDAVFFFEVWSASFYFAPFFTKLDNLFVIAKITYINTQTGVDVNEMFDCE